jgi:hypothetical protein
MIPPGEIKVGKAVMTTAFQVLDDEIPAQASRRYF